MPNTVVECNRCKEVFPQEKIFTVCPKCGGALLIRYNLKAIKKIVSLDDIEKRHETFWKFLEFLPNGPAFTSLCQLTQFYAGIEPDFEFRLMLKGDAIPESRLGVTSGPRLGWTSWLKTRKFEAEYGLVSLSPRWLDSDFFKE